MFPSCWRLKNTQLQKPNNKTTTKKPTTRSQLSKLQNHETPTTNPQPKTKSPTTKLQLKTQQHNPNYKTALKIAFIFAPLGLM